VVADVFVVGGAAMAMAYDAMKALAARPRDTEDLRTLAGLARVSTVEEAVRLCRDFYPDEALSPRALAVLEEFFE
jgi:hypothetical protein